MGTGIGCIGVMALFLILHLIFPESTVKFDYRVVLGALCGGAVAVANFFLMALTVQSVVNVENKDDALRMMRVSYRNRMLMRGLWVIIAIVAPCFNYAAGIIPLFIPGFVIKIRGIRMGITQWGSRRRSRRPVILPGRDMQTLPQKQAQKQNQRQILRPCRKRQKLQKKQKLLWKLILRPCRKRQTRQRKQNSRKHRHQSVAAHTIIYNVGKHEGGGEFI